MQANLQFRFTELFQIIVYTHVGTGLPINFGMLATGKHK